MELEREKKGKKEEKTVDCVLRRCLEQFRQEKRGWGTKGITILCEMRERDFVKIW